MGSKYLTADAAAPVHSAISVTKSDTTVLQPTRALWIGGAGDVSVVMAGNEATVTFIGVPVGTLLPIQVTKVLVATTATNILALS